MTSRTWSDADSPVVSVTPSTVNDVTRVIPGRTGSSDTLRFRLLSTNIISFVLPRFNWRRWSLIAERQSDAQRWASECPDVNNSCTRMATVGVNSKGEITKRQVSFGFYARPHACNTVRNWRLSAVSLTFHNTFLFPWDIQNSNHTWKVL